MYDTILVPTDGSDHAARAAEHAAYLARVFDATVHLVTVVDVQGAAGLFDAGGVDDAFVDRLETRGREAIDAATAVVGEGTRVETDLVRGEPSAAILEYAADAGADVIAMGTRGRSGVDRYIAGSVTERVLRLAEVPVLTVRETDATRVGDYEEVLVPTDGSDPAGAAVEHALAIAAATGARVHAVNVVDVGALGAGIDTGSGPVPALREALIEAGERATDAIVSRATERGVDAVAEVAMGSPAASLIGYAEGNDIDLVTMGTRGRRGVERYLLGSTTERVVRRADAPVLAVNAANRES